MGEEVAKAPGCMELSFSVRSDRFQFREILVGDNEKPVTFYQSVFGIQRP